MSKNRAIDLIKQERQFGRVRQEWLNGLVVWFLLRVQEVPGSNPGWAPMFFFKMLIWQVIGPGFMPCKFLSIPIISPIFHHPPKSHTLNPSHHHLMPKTAIVLRSFSVCVFGMPIPLLAKEYHCLKRPVLQWIVYFPVVGMDKINNLDFVFKWQLVNEMCGLVWSF